MTFPEIYSSVLSMYQQTATAGVWKYLEKQAGLHLRQGIYTPVVVFWLMVAKPA